MTEEQQEKLAMQARMFDLGHTPEERVVNRVYAAVKAGRVSKDELREAIADESTSEAIQELYG
ncbi:MAG: hypothetical protein ACYDGR_03015 [Candidatus Dormibacteria bacterium]